MFYVKHSDFDIIVVGGGHAGVEAALAAGRMGRTVALVTMDRRKLALMSCNPAIGGLGKSHIVKEIDALGGVMGQAIDATGIQFRKLNLSRGPAVWATRAQADRIGYNDFICSFVEAQKNVSVIEATAGEILVEHGRTVGIRTEDGQAILAGAVIICSGTFLGGLIHIGDQQIPAGRRGEKGAYKLSDSFRSLGFEIGRLKTGTPPRLDGKTIDFSKCEAQPGLEPPPFFSYRSPARDVKQVPCHLTYTTNQTKEIIMANLNKSAMFSGQISSRGPRYCPSIEDKIYRFNDKPRHHIFLEPEGNGTDEIYPNGFSTSLPADVQLDAIRTVTGLENVEMTQAGYAIEYDYCPSHQITPSLETRFLPRLFLAGQINGTSGYEEAAGLGLIAGVNAVLGLENEPPFVPDRAESYIGVMLDDLVSHSTTEPYRMFTSRAEYRLRLREDNARDRLIEYARKYSLIPEDHYDSFLALQNRTRETISALEKKHVPVVKLDGYTDYFVKRQSISLADILKIPGVDYKYVTRFLENGERVDDKILERASVAIKYAGYISKQEREVEKFRENESRKIPDDMPYEKLTGLRNEAREKFARFRPSSLGQASRIEGVTVGDIAALSIHVRKYSFQKK